jgi:hypothetical protein
MEFLLVLIKILWLITKALALLGLNLFLYIIIKEVIYVLRKKGWWLTKEELKEIYYINKLSHMSRMDIL